MTTNIISLKAAALARGRKLEKLSQRTRLPEQAPPRSTVKIDFEQCLYERGLSFPLEHVVIIEGSGELAFEPPAFEKTARDVFARWGLSMDDYTSSFEELVGAWLVFSAECVRDLRKLEEPSPYAPPPTGNDLAYLRAAAAHNIRRASQLFPKTTYASKVRSEIELNQLRTAVRSRAKRADARQNAVIAYILSQRILRSSATTFGESIEKLFAACRNSDCAIGTCREWDPTRSLTKKLQRRGLQLGTDCPLDNEIAFLLDAAPLESHMARSKLRHEWRALLGPFVGFDQTWGLLMEKDLGYFKGNHPLWKPNWNLSSKERDRTRTSATAASASAMPATTVRKPESTADVVSLDARGNKSGSRDHS